MEDLLVPDANVRLSPMSPPPSRRIIHTHHTGLNIPCRPRGSSQPSIEETTPHIKRTHAGCLMCKKRYIFTLADSDRAWTKSI